MILGLLTMFFLSGGAGGMSGSMLTPDSINELSERAGTVILDSARAAAAQQTLAELQKEVEAFQEIFWSSGEQLDKVYKDHADDGDQAQSVLDELNVDWEVEQKRAVDLRFKLRRSVSKQEWAELFVAHD